jgi:hypothetical protein
MPKETTDLERITVESAENGFMVTCQYAAPKPKKGDKNMPTWVEPQRYVYADAAGVLKKIGQVLGGLKKSKGGRTLADVGAPARR